MILVYSFRFFVYLLLIYKYQSYRCVMSYLESTTWNSCRSFNSGTELQMY